MKIMGSAVLIGGALYASAQAKSEERARFADTSALEELIAYIRGQIQQYKTPLCEIWSNYPSENVRIRDFCRMAMQGGAQKALAALNLSTADREALKRFIARMGQGYLEDELKRCDELLLILNRSVSELRENMPKKAKLNASLWMLGAVSLMILLL